MSELNHRAVYDEVPEGSSPSSVGSFSVAFVILVAVATMSFGSTFATNEPRWILAAWALSAAGVLGVIGLLVSRLLPGYLAPLFFVGGQAVGSIALCLSLATLPTVSLEKHPIPYLLSDPPRCFLALVVPAFGLLLVAGLCRCFSSRVWKSRSIGDVATRLPASFEWVMIATALIEFSNWFAGEEAFSASLVAYATRILAKTLTMTPFLAGYLALKFRRSALVWLATFALGLILSFFTGSRGTVFLPLIPFLIGFLIALPSWRRRLQIGFALLPVFVALYFLGALVGAQRGETGRHGVLELQNANLGDFVSMSSAFLSKEESKSSEESSMLNSGVTRFVAWPNLAIPVMTPDYVGYRGFGDLSDEFLSQFRLGRVEGVGYNPNLIANNYGFLVNEETSVEFGIGADGASRAGMAGVLLYGMVAALALIALEALSRHFFDGGVYLLCAMVGCSVGAYDMGRTGLLSSLRAGASAWLMIVLACLAYDAWRRRSQLSRPATIG